MDAAIIARVLAGIGALVVAYFALRALVDEWKKTALEDQVTKIMMILLTVGCIIVLAVAFRFAGRV